jgi:hypothetical protein
MVITQESAQSLAALNRPVAADVRTPREQQDVALPLMIPLGMEMFDILAQGSPQGARRITLDKHSSFTDLTQRSA